ncbi:MFS general substrate transporter [Mollisia scopiformis]|uniref:MFS general substrate transporter n=1 Tax=Mollisia scopiformis TaxID=149040 RepID=A0A132B3K1_MOLSC|nr:MFS general substrate transporter [Mollisia scopiformis]KUJ06247.1 MFS general substrate transporter [Mollisia scopiformis]
MSEKSLNRARWVSSVAATCISLACGTNYVYSAWGPQFGARLKLSSTEQNLIGAFGNLGMYAMGIPVGMFVDTKGPRPAVIFGAIMLAAGYFPLHQAYDAGSGSVPLLCIYSLFTGFGGCAAFNAAMKTSALNWPHHRGTATGFNLAAFGLSAFFFSTLAQYALPGNTGDFLMLLSVGTSGIAFIGFFFLRVYPHPHYSAVSTNSGRRLSDSQRLHRTRSAEEGKHKADQTVLEPGEDAPESLLVVSDETSSLLSTTTSSSPGDAPEEPIVKDHAHRVDIRGFKMLVQVEFWLQWAIMGLLTGVGLMTINNIGNDAAALWLHYDDSVSNDFIAKSQAMHVSILSLGSFTGRLLSGKYTCSSQLSGIGSDFLVKVLHASRYWCLSIASLIFLLSQFFALSIENPNYLAFVSSSTGLAYGFLFGCFPSIVAEAFGVHGFSTNWGFMTLSPVVSGNVFNVFYGTVFDAHSIVKPDGSRECTEGLACYKAAYYITITSCLIGLAVSLWTMWYVTKKRKEEDRQREFEEREA